MRILLADHQVQLRKALVILLARFPAYEITGEIGSARDLIQTIERTAPDLILLDLGLPGLKPRIELPQIRTLSPNVIIIGMSANSIHSARDQIPELDACITKREPASKLLAMLQKYALLTNAASTEKA